MANNVPTVSTCCCHRSSLASAEETTTAGGRALARYSAVFWRTNAFQPNRLPKTSVNNAVMTIRRLAMPPRSFV